MTHEHTMVCSCVLIKSVCTSRSTCSHTKYASFRMLFCTCGERGIRTLGTRKRTAVFKTAAFNHSAISPKVCNCIYAPAYITKRATYIYMYIHVCVHRIVANNGHFSKCRPDTKTTASCSGCFCLISLRVGLLQPAETFCERRCFS